MEVLLKRNWYTPNRQFFLAGQHTFPESFKEILPESAEILEEAPEVNPVEEAEKPKAKPAAKKAETK